MNMIFSETVQMQVAVYLLVLVRVSGIFLIAPFYSGSGVPPQLKVGLSFFLALCVAPSHLHQGPEALAALGSLGGLALAVASELAVGFAIGMAGAVAMGAIQTAGSFIAQDIGLTIANVIDPISSLQTSVIGQLKVAFALFIFLGLNFHHEVVRAISGSFRMLPLGALAGRFASGGGSGLGEIAILQGSNLFEASLRLALPVSATLLLVSLAMAFLARAVPEINVFALGFGLRILVGFWVIVLIVPLLAEIFQRLFERAAREGEETLRALAGG